jgi:hypothetical protein
MECKSQGAEKDIQVSPLQHKTLAHAEQIETDNGQEHSSPKQLSDPLPYEKSKAWNQNYIKRSDETCLPCAGILDSHLLQVGGKAEEKTADKASCKKHAALLTFGWQHGVAAAEYRDEGNKKKTTYKGADRVECKRLHIRHPYPLGNKGRAPYKSGKQKQQASGHFFVFHINQIIKFILVCKYFFCYIVDE